MNLLLRALRRLATARGFRRLTSVTPLLRLSFALRATLVRERTRFVLNELRPRPTTAVYRLRESGVAIAIRHHTGDVMVLDEIFSQREYEPPPEVALTGVETAVDLGANIGLFGAWLLGRSPEVQMLSYEPDPENAAVLRLAVEANALQHRWRVVEAFAAASPGTTTFAAGLHAVSREGEGIVVPVADVLPELAGVDLVKIDIEGAEWAILGDPRFSDVGANILVLEYHADGCPAADPAAAAERALVDAGYAVRQTGWKPAFGAGIVWGIRR